MAFYPAVPVLGNIQPPLPVADGGTGVTTGALVNQATTGVAGFALQNGTPTIMTWSVPNDGKMHHGMVFATLDVTSTETGGAVTLTVTDPGGGLGTHTLLAGGASSGSSTIPSAFPFAAEAGSSVIVAQSSALTGGAATLYGSIWGL